MKLSDVLGSAVKWFTGSRSDEAVQIDLGNGMTVPISETTSGKSWAQIAKGICPECKKKTKFFEGPQGGMSINIQCESCGFWWNVTDILGMAEPIGYKARSGDSKENPPWRLEDL